MLIILLLFVFFLTLPHVRPSLSLAYFFVPAGSALPVRRGGKSPCSTSHEDIYVRVIGYFLHYYYDYVCTISIVMLLNQATEWMLSCDPTFCLSTSDIPHYCYQYNKKNNQKSHKSIIMCQLGYELFSFPSIFINLLYLCHFSHSANFDQKSLTWMLVILYGVAGVDKDNF